MDRLAYQECCRDCLTRITHSINATCVLARPVHGLARVAIPGQLHHVTRRSVIEDFSIYAGSLRGSGGKAGLAWAKATSRRSSGVEQGQSEVVRHNGRKGNDMQELPRIERVAVEVPSTCASAGAANVRPTGEPRRLDCHRRRHPAPLADTDLFRQARVASYGSAIAWDDDDLAIDALHLKRLADEQRPFGNSDLRAWQTATRLSNAEAAEFSA